MNNANAAAYRLRAPNGGCPGYARSSRLARLRSPARKQRWATANATLTPYSLPFQCKHFGTQLPSGAALPVPFAPRFLSCLRIKHPVTGVPARLNTRPVASGYLSGIRTRQTARHCQAATSGCFRLEHFAEWDLHPWKAPPLHGQAVEEVTSRLERGCSQQLDVPPRSHRTRLILVPFDPEDPAMNRICTSLRMLPLFGSHAPSVPVGIPPRRPSAWARRLMFARCPSMAPR